MADFGKEVELLLKNGIFDCLFNSKEVQVAQFTAAIALLIKLGIPFDVQFTQNTKRDPATAQLTIYLNSTSNTSTAIQFTIEFNC